MHVPKLSTHLPSSRSFCWPHAREPQGVHELPVDGALPVSADASGRSTA